MIHRDIKPANIIPGPFGEVLLLDWSHAMILSDDNRHDDAARLLQSQLMDMQGKSFMSGANVYPANSFEERFGQIKILNRQGNLPKAKEVAYAVAAFVEELKRSLSESSSTWDIVPDYQLQLSNFFHQLEDELQSRHHDVQPVLILERVTQKALYPPAGHARFVNAMIERSELFSDRDKPADSTQIYETAAATLTNAIESAPDDLSLQKTEQDLNRSRGRFALHQQVDGSQLLFGRVDSVHASSIERKKLC